MYQIKIRLRGPDLIKPEYFIDGYSNLHITNQWEFVNERCNIYFPRWRDTQKEPPRIQRKCSHEWDRITAQLIVNDILGKGYNAFYIGGIIPENESKKELFVFSIREALGGRTKKKNDY